MTWDNDEQRTVMSAKMLAQLGHVFEREAIELAAENPIEEIEYCRLTGVAADCFARAENQGFDSCEAFWEESW